MYVGSEYIQVTYLPPHEPFFFFSRFRIMFTEYTESILVFLRKASWEFQVKFCFLKGTSWISSPTTYRLSPFQYPPISLCFSLYLSLSIYFFLLHFCLTLILIIENPSALKGLAVGTTYSHCQSTEEIL